MLSLDLAAPGRPLSVLCLGAHCDDIEIGAGGTILTWAGSQARLDIHWCVAAAAGPRGEEARASAASFLEGSAKATLALGEFRDSYLPYEGAAVKAWVEVQKARMPAPDVVLTHRRDDAHQDHRLICDLAWNSFRDSLILEYEIPKWDGDLGRPNAYLALTDAVMARKSALLHHHFGSQRGKDWFDAETFTGLARLRGLECRTRYAEAFWANKIRLG
jgi:LmbE family N-acetylglucosaminyl deacetylase